MCFSFLTVNISSNEYNQILVQEPIRINQFIVGTHVTSKLQTASSYNSYILKNLLMLLKDVSASDPCFLHIFSVLVKPGPLHLLFSILGKDPVGQYSWAQLCHV